MLAFYAPAIFFDGLIQKSVLDAFLLCLALWLMSGIIAIRTRPAFRLRSAENLPATARYA